MWPLGQIGSYFCCSRIFIVADTKNVNLKHSRIRKNITAREAAMATAQIPITKAKSRRRAVDQNSHKTIEGIIKNTTSIKGPIPVKPIKRNKQWQKIVTNDFRSYMLLKLINTVYSVGDDFQYRVVFDERLQSIVEFFKRRELKMFKAAESRSEYLRLLADDVFEIQREIESKYRRQMDQHERLCTLSCMVLDNLRKL